MQCVRENDIVPFGNRDVELGSLHHSSPPSFHDDGISDCSSLRSSLDNDYYLAQSCEIQTYDDGYFPCQTALNGEGAQISSWSGELGELGGFKRYLEVCACILGTMMKLIVFRRRIPTGLAGCKHPHLFKQTSRAQRASSMSLGGRVPT